MLSLSLKLILVHFIGDFVLQPTNWVEDKSQKGIKSPFLYVHIVVHTILLLVVFQFDWQEYKMVILVSSISHLIIDAVKISIEKRFQWDYIFWIDQLLHIMIIGIIVYSYMPFEIDWTTLYGIQSLSLIVAVVFITSVSSVIMRIVMSKWNTRKFSLGSLAKAGMYIGILERVLVFTFVVLGQWQSIGFLIAAKSVFRFGDLSKAKNKQLTEYVLIGTLISFGLAIIAGLVYLQLVKGVSGK